MATKAKKVVKRKISKTTKTVKAAKPRKAAVKKVAKVAKTTRAAASKKKVATKTVKAKAAKKTTAKKSATKKAKSTKAKGAKAKAKTKAKTAKAKPKKKARVGTKAKATKAKPKAALKKKASVGTAKVTGKGTAVKAAKSIASSSVHAKKASQAKPVVKKAAVKVATKPTSTVTKSTAKTTKSMFPMTAIISLMDTEITPYQEQYDEEYMNEKQRSHFRNLLLQRKQQLLEEMDRTVHHLQDEAANYPDPNDRATQEEEFSLELRARDRERKFIKNIEEALQRLDEGEYGYCEACGVEIGVRRLEARPTATQCIDCKTLDEIRERQMGG